ncbi:MAG: DNA double-strand break repair nuclease NurA [Gemmatimonadota bacterium]
MLDFAAVKAQVDSMVADQVSRPPEVERRLGRAVAELRRWGATWAELAERARRSHTSWLLAELAGDPTARRACPPRPERLTVAATDGSQIYPDRHEVSPCYLINIGYVLLHYGTGERPLLSSQPRLYYRDADLFEDWGGRRVSVNRDQVGLRRSLLEMTELAELAAAAQDSGYAPVALSDGTLIAWSLEGRPPEQRRHCLAALTGAFDTLRRRRIPVAGYISRPGSQDLTNLLRLGLCPLEAADCDHCPWREAGEGPPCGAIDGIGDAVLFRQVLRPGERSAVFGSTSRVLDDYGPHRVRFFYLHVGDEVARVEVPAWVAEDAALLDLVHACVRDQAAKGQGYPVCLAEAHERAVVRGADRELFYRYLEDTFVSSDVRARVSTKGLRKRYAGV